MSGDVKLTLTRDEFETLLIVAGMAMGTAVKLGDHRLMIAFLKLTNAINKDNPHWTNYEIPNDAKLPAK